MKLGGVNRRRDDAFAIGRRQLPRPEAGGDLLQRMPSSDLSVAPLVHEAVGAPRQLNSSSLTLDLERFEPRHVDGLERQRVLKALDGRCVELTGRLERAFALQPGSIAFKTQWTSLKSVGTHPHA